MNKVAYNICSDSGDTGLSLEELTQFLVYKKSALFVSRDSVSLVPNSVIQNLRSWDHNEQRVSLKQSIAFLLCTSLDVQLI